MIVVSILAGCLVFGGPPAVVVTAMGMLVWRRRSARSKPPPLRPVLMMLLVELRSGMSVLASLQSVSRRFPDHRALASSVRVATVSGIDRAVATADGDTKVMLAHLARSLAGGGSGADAIRRMLDSDLAREKATRLARARSLPVQMMVPLTLFLLPGVVLVSYGPTLVALIDDLAVPFG